MAAKKTQEEIEQTLDKADVVVELVQELIESSEVSLAPEPVPSSFLRNPNYPTDYFIGNGIPYCQLCGGPNRSDMFGNPLCEDHVANCPRLKQ
jgi:hypothetical protein